MKSDKILKKSVIDIIHHLPPKAKLKLLEKLNNKSITFSLSNAQKRYWFYQKTELNSPVCNIPVILEINGLLDLKILESSFEFLIKQHKILNTQIFNNNQILKQKIDQKLPEIIKINLQRLKEECKKFEKERIMRCFLTHAFNVDKDKFMRIALLINTEKQYTLLMSFHHIIIDGWSLGILLEQLKSNYETLLLGNIPKVNNFLHSYQQFIEHENSEGSKNCWSYQLKYWQIKLKDMPSNIKFLFPKKPLYQNDNYGKMYYFDVPNNIFSKIKKINTTNKNTLYTYMLSAFFLLLNKISGQKDLIVATPYGNRKISKFERTVGLFQNLVLIRKKINLTETFGEFLNKTKRNCLEAFDNADLPYNLLVKELNNNNLDLLNLTNVMFIYNNAPLKEVNVGPLKFKPRILDLGFIYNDLTLVIFDDIMHGLKCRIEYKSNVFSQNDVTNMVETYINLLENSTYCIERKIQDISCYSPGKFPPTYILGEKKLLDEKNLFEDFFKTQNSHTIAIEHNQIKISYEELNKYSNKLIFYFLKVLKIKPGDTISIVSDRSIFQIIFLLTILRINCTYLPISITEARSQKNFLALINIAQPKFILTEDLELIKKYQSNKIPLLSLKSWRALLDQYPSKNIICIDNTEADIAYIIFTSGTTGTRKGVRGTYKGLINRLYWYWDKYPFNKYEVCCQKTSISFIDSITETLAPILKGVKLVIFDDEIIKTYTKLIDYINLYNISRITLVPSLLREVLENIPEKFAFNTLKYVISSGEALDSQLIKKFKTRLPNIFLLNFYGSSETCGDISYYQLPDLYYNLNNPIGNPIYNTALYVLDNDMLPVPKGIIGKLFVSSTNIANGYLNYAYKKEEEKFLVNHFYGHYDTFSKTIYNTGDLCRWSSQFVLEYFGRHDTQMNHKGYRIDATYIEKFLNLYDNIQQSIVIQNKNDHILIAILRTKKQLYVDKIRKYLLENLPTYMVPEKYIFIEKEFPLNINQKVDRNRLQEIYLQGDIKSLQKERRINFYHIQWVEDKLNRKVKEQYLHNSCQNKSLIFFSTETKIELLLIKKLKKFYNKIIIVKEGQVFKKHSADTYTVANGSSTCFYKLFKNIKADYTKIDRIIYCWTTKDTTNLQDKNNIFKYMSKAEETINYSFFNLLLIAQNTNFNDDLYFIILTTQLCTKIWKNKIQPEKAAILGVINVLDQEIKSFTSKCIDIDTNIENEENIISFIDLLFNEIFIFNEKVVAISQQKIFKRKFLEISTNKIDCKVINYNQSHKKNYIITGGLGGIGLVFTEHIINTHNKVNIIILGRTKLPKRNEWEKFLSDSYCKSNHIAITNKITKILELEKNGAKIEYIECDVANLTQMRKEFHNIYKNYKIINGVIHAAGLLNLSLVALKTHDDIVAQFNAKIYGTLVLDTLINFDTLEFFLLCSSMNAIVGGIGTVDYSASNSFLDQYAHLKNYTLKSNKVHSINWDMWKEVGMASFIDNLPEKFQKIHQLKLDNALLNKEALKAFQKILKIKKSQIIITPENLDYLFKRENELLNNITQNVQFYKLEEEKLQSRPTLQIEYTAASDNIEKELVKIWQMLLSLNQVGINDNFFDLGGHSLIAAQAIDRINKTFNCSLNIKDLFNNPTIELIRKLIPYNKSFYENK